MKTELSWLIDLLLNQKLSTNVKKLVGWRIAEVEAHLSSSITVTHTSGYVAPFKQVNNPTAQCASTQAILDSDPNIQPVVQIAQTAKAMQALEDRAEMIRQATSGKEEKGRTSPRKF